MVKYDVIIVGAGLGGRTSSFYKNGLYIESGLHRFIGYFTALPTLLKKCDVKLNDIITWEDKIDILIKNQQKKKSSN